MRRLRAIVRLRGRWSIRRWRWGRPIIRRRRRRPVRSCLRTIRWRWSSRVVGGWRRCWPIRWRSRSGLRRLCGRRSRGPLICRRRSSRTIRCRGGRGLSRPRHVCRRMTGCRRRWLSWRRYLHHRTRCRCGRRTQRLHFASCQRLSRMRRKSLLLFRKRHRRRRGRFLRNYLPACNRGRRRSHVTCGRRLGAQNALSGWSHGDSCTHRRGCDLGRADLNSRRRYRLGAHECVLWHHHHRTLHITVRVGFVRDRGGVVVNNGRVIDVGHLRNIHRRTADVDAGHVSFAHMIGRHINFSWT